MKLSPCVKIDFDDLTAITTGRVQYLAFDPPLHLLPFGSISRSHFVLFGCLGLWQLLLRSDCGAGHAFLMPVSWALWELSTCWEFHALPRGVGFSKGRSRVPSKLGGNSSFAARLLGGKLG